MTRFENEDARSAAEQAIEAARARAEKKEVKFDRLDEVGNRKIDIGHQINVVEISTDVKGYIDKRINAFRADVYSEQSETGRVRVHLTIRFMNVIGDDEQIVEERFVLPRRALAEKSAIVKAIEDYIMDIPNGDKTIVEGVALCLMQLAPTLDKCRVMASDRMTAEEAHHALVREVKKRKRTSPKDYRFEKIDGVSVVCIFGKKNLQEVVKAACGGDWKTMELLRTWKAGFYKKNGVFLGSILILSDRREYTRELSDHRYYYVVKRYI